MKKLQIRMYQALGYLARDTKGQDLIEYALLAASIAVAVAATFPQTIAPAVSSIFSRIISSFTASQNIGS
ncbi:MAG: Flp family type IVb pilin [Acidobacteria bacterium]|nr:Flp family type IVb pilin [Acidobacteriota bacterium]